MQATDNPCFHAAKQYREHGWNAITLCPPCHVGVGRVHSGFCKSPGKVPIESWKRWQTEFIPGWEHDRSWRVHPNANLGVVLGKVSRLVAVDVDGPEGLKILHAILNEKLSGQEVSTARSALGSTSSFKTSRGTRLLFTTNGERDIVGFTRKSLDLQSEVKLLSLGTQTVMPPSLHKSGVRYEWLVNKDPMLLPAWLHTMPLVQTDVPRVVEGERIREGARNEKLFRMACCLRRQGGTPEEIRSMMQLINHRCEPPLELQEIESTLRSVLKYKPFAGVAR